MKVVELTNEKEKNLLLEQYRILTEVVNTTTENRESLNTFWTSLNGTIFAAVAYIKDMEIGTAAPKTLFVWVIILFGFIMSVVWVKSISCIKKNIDTKNSMLIEIEKFLPAKIFTIELKGKEQKKNNYSLSSNETSIPILFCIGYIIIAVILLVYPNIL